MLGEVKNGDDFLFVQHAFYMETLVPLKRFGKWVFNKKLRFEPDQENGKVFYTLQSIISPRTVHTTHTP